MSTSDGAGTGSADVESQLRRGNPLVPTDSASSRALVAVIAVLTFLAALAAGGAEMVAQSSRDWRASIMREATIQLRPARQRDLDADLARAAEIARATPGIQTARILPRSEAEDLLEPWLGRGLDLRDLPVPRLIVLKLDPGRAPDLAGLASRLAEQMPGATVDDHGAWVARLTTMANTVVFAAFGLVLLVLGAAGAAVVFATRGAMVANRDIVEVLHFVGATDRFIAREFHIRFLKFGLRGGLYGAAGACAFIAGCAALCASMLGGAPASQIEALFGSFGMGWVGSSRAAPSAVTFRKAERR
jgi:cell division transport system permease protein